MKKEDLFMRLCGIRDRFLKDAFNPIAASAISKVYIEGYLTGLLNAGFINGDEYEKFIKEWCK